MAIDPITYNTATEAQDLATQSLANAHPWVRNHTYQIGDVCIMNSNFWLCSMSHISGNSFDTGYWQELNSDASRIKGYLIDLGALTDGCTLVYNLSTNKFEARVINNTPSQSGAQINDSGIIGNTTETYSINKILTLLNSKLNASSIATVATTGAYSDLIGKPSIPTLLSQLSNDVNYITGILDSDNTLSSNSDARVSTQKAIKFYVDSRLGSITSGMSYKGIFDASTGVFPANITQGDFYKISVAGVVSGLDLSIGDMIIANKTKQGSIVASDWDKVDNTESADILRIGNVSTNSDFTVDTGKLVDRSTIANYITNQLSNKLNKVVGATSNNIPILNSDGSLSDSGKKLSDYALSNDVGNKSLLVTTVKDDLVSAINEAFTSGVNFKSDLAQTINSKNTTTPVSSSSTKSEFITAVNNIPATTFSGSNVVEITKLNITGSVSTPYIKTVNLTNPINDKLILTGVREFIPSSASTQLISTFDNTDSSAFFPNSKVTYDGSMHLTSNNITNTMTNTTSSNTGITTGIEWTYTVDKSLFNSVDSISLTDGTTPTITVNGTNFPQIITTTTDIDLIGIDALNGVIFNNTTTNGGQCLLAISVDSGSTYKAYNQGTDTWQTIDITSISDFSSKGMSKGLTDVLTSTQMEALRNGSTKIRFAYYLSVTSASSVATTQDISINVQVSGHYVTATKSDYDVIIGSDNQSILFKFYKNGTFSMNYVNN